MRRRHVVDARMYAIVVIPGEPRNVPLLSEKERSCAMDATKDVELPALAKEDVSVTVTGTLS